MKILFLGTSFALSGGTRIVLEYASRLATHGHEVTVAIELRDPLRRFAYNFLHIGPRWMPFRARPLRVASFDADSLPEADVVIATNIPTAHKAALLPEQNGKKFFLLQHEEGLYHFDRHLSDLAYALPLRKIVVSTWLQDVLREKYGQESDILINPVDHAQFHRLPRTVRDGTIRVGLLHHTYAWKGTAEGAQIVTELKKKHPNVRLVLFGIRKEAVDMPCDEYHYNLPQERLAEFYSSLDIFLCPSWDEGFGLPSVEAMACGAALVTYDNGGSRDYAFHEKTALVAPRRDATALFREVERLVVDKDLRKRIAEAGQRFAAEMPGWDERVTELETLLTQA